MTVLERIQQCRANSPVHMTLIDPDKQSAAQAGEIARIATKVGTDAIMIGGSGKISQAEADATVKAIKAATDVPTILFPGEAEAVAPSADAIFFMSLLNSRSPRFLIREQAKAAPYLKPLGIEPLPMGYLIIEPGMRAGEVGEADAVPRDNPKLAVGYALAAEYYGMSIVYLEAGSGAPEPVPTEMVQAVRSALSILLCVGGGIRSPEAAAAAVAAGADIVVTGTLVEQAADIEAALGPVIDAVKGK